MSNFEIWRPFTQEKTAKPSIKAVSGSGSFIFDESGKKYLDLISSWWVNLHGHANQEIAEAIYEQSKKLEHVIFTKFSHDPAEKICKRLSSVLAPKLSKFFFSDNGSTAVEIALKMAYQYWKNKGYKNKNKFISFFGGYHGDTVGAMSVGSGYHEKFKDICFDSLKIPWPSTWIGDDNVEEKEKLALQEYKKIITSYGDNIVAIILEPMVQGASGMRMIRPEFLRQIFNISKENDIIVIFDEVMTGFFRTGKMFTYEHISDDKISYVPDIMCVSKGITGGFLPLALTITSEDIYCAFLGNSDECTFLHGHSYTANPIGCAAAVASFDLLQRNECKQNIAMINGVHLQWHKKLGNHKFIRYHRILGTISAFEISDDIYDKMDIIAAKMLEAGFLIRPLRNVVYLIPPYCTSYDNLNASYETLLNIIDEKML